MIIIHCPERDTFPSDHWAFVNLYHLKTLWGTYMLALPNGEHNWTFYVCHPTHSSTMFYLFGMTNGQNNEVTLYCDHFHVRNQWSPPGTWTADHSMCTINSDILPLQLTGSTIKILPRHAISPHFNVIYFLKINKFVLVRIICSILLKYFTAHHHC